MPMIHTDRLDLVAATVQYLDAELTSAAALGVLLGAQVPDGWPPGEYDRGAIEFFRARLSEDAAAAGWYSWYVVERAAPGQSAVLVGAGGFFGPPRTDGVVEVGYSIVPAFQGRGLASELVHALVTQALASPGVERVIAHTHPENSGSIKVLERAGFHLVGPGELPGTLQYARSKSSA